MKSFLPIIRLCMQENRKCPLEFDFCFFDVFKTKNGCALVYSSLRIVSLKKEDKSYGKSLYLLSTLISMDERN